METTSLNNNSPFPFGKYKGTPLKNIPKEYWDWLKTQSWFGKWSDLKAYLEARRPKPVKCEKTSEVNWQAAMAPAILDFKGRPLDPLVEFLRVTTPQQVAEVGLQTIRTLIDRGVINAGNVEQFAQLPAAVLKGMAV